MLFRIEHLCVSYSGIPALSDINLDIDQGEFVGLVGASGSGKSTLAKACVGLLSPSGRIDSGTIAFKDRNLVGAPASKMREVRGAHIGFVFQNPGTSFSPIRRLDVQYNEAMAAHGKTDTKENERLLLDTFAKLGLSGGKRILQSYPFELSGGMAQRVAIAFAIALRPELLIADEPTSALDVTVQAQVISELMTLRKDFGTSVLLISHNIGMVAYCCDRMCVMHDGRIVERGESRQVLAHPQDAYTKKLIAAVPSISASVPASSSGTSKKGVS